MANRKLKLLESASLFNYQYGPTIIVSIPILSSSESKILCGKQGNFDQTVGVYEKAINSD